MFLKEKFTGIFEKMKARLVAGGDQQDKALYEDLSAVSTSFVFAVAAIAAAEGRKASMDSRVIVDMRSDPLMSTILRELSSDYT